MPGRHGDQERHEREERQQHGTRRVHVVRPHRDRQRGDRQRGVDQRGVTEDRLAGEHREDLADDAEERQRDDVHLGVSEEPEQVLPQQHTAVGGVVDVRAEVAVGGQAEQRGGQQREGHQHQDRRHQDVPGEDRHPEHRHARSAHADHGGDHVDAAEDGAETTDGQAQDPQVTARARRVDRVGQRAIGGPAEVGGAARGDEAGDRDRRAEQEQPEAQRVQPRERDVGRADLQRQHQVGEPEHDRGGVEQQHHRAVHGEQLVELLVGQELQPRQRELGAHEQRHQPADEEEDEAGDAVHDADQLVIGGRHQLVDQVALGTEPGRERPTGLEFSDWGRFGYQQVLQTSSRDIPAVFSDESYLSKLPDVGVGPTNCRKSHSDIGGWRPDQLRTGPDVTVGDVLISGPRVGLVAAATAIVTAVSVTLISGCGRCGGSPPSTAGQQSVITSTTKIAGAGVLGNQRRPDESCAPDPAALDPGPPDREVRHAAGTTTVRGRPAAHRRAVG